MRVGDTLRKWFHREEELSEIERAKRWAAAREPHALTHAEFDEIIRRAESDPRVAKAFQEEEMLRRQRSEARTTDGLQDQVNGDSKRNSG